MTIYVDANGREVKRVLDKPSVDLRVTDWKCRAKTGDMIDGYLMNRYLYDNLKQIPSFVRNDNAIIGLISGTNSTRTGKSTMGIQIGYLIAFLLAGGQMNPDGTIKKKPKVKPALELHFDIDTLQDAVEKSEGLHKVFILDEASDAGGSRSAQTKKNKEWNNFIVRSAFKNYILILILPDFFALSNNYATAYSQFLVNVFRNGEKRGYFSFFGPNKKEILYFKGKKIFGSQQRYRCVKPDFNGRFSRAFPSMTPNEYNDKKLEALNKLMTKEKKTPTSINTDIMIKGLYEDGKKQGLTQEAIADKIKAYGIEMNPRKIRYAITKANKYLKSKGIVEDKNKDIQYDTDDVQEVIIEEGVENE